MVDAEKVRRESWARSSKSRLQPPAAQVTVLSGRVGVTADQDAEQQILTAGQQVAYGEGSAQKTPRGGQRGADGLASGLAQLLQGTLADVVQDLGRYYPGRIVLLNDELAARRVSGSFPSRDPQAVLSSLQGVLGFEQHQVLGHLIILR